LSLITLIEVITMVRQAPAMTVRQNLGELINEVQYRGDSVVITKSGKAVAAIIDMELFERLRGLDDQYAQLRTDIVGAFGRLAPDDGAALIDEAVQAARTK